MITLRPLRLLVCAAAVSLCVSSAYAGQLRVAWDANPEPEVTGYFVSYGTSSRAYDHLINVGPVTDYTIYGLTDGQRYFIAVSAYTATGLRSNYSAEVSEVVGLTSAPLVQVDAPAAAARVAQPFTVAGWALDSFSQFSPGIDAIHVYAYPDTGGNPIFVGAGQYGSSRPDVGAAFGSQFTPSGYSLQVGGLAPGNYHLVVFARSTITGQFQPSSPVGMTVLAAPEIRPVVAIDAPRPDSTVGGDFSVAGWTADLAATGSDGIDVIHVWAYPDSGSPIFVGAAQVGIARPDVASVFGARLLNSGFSLAAHLPAGHYTLAVYPHSSVTGAFGGATTVRVTVSLAVSRPAMAIDAPVAGAVSRTFVIAGWAFDAGAPAGTGVDAIHVWAFPVSGGNPVFVGVATYGVLRTDVGAAFGTRFRNSGYSLSVVSGQLRTGVYDLAVYAHSTVTGTFNSSRAVRITVP